MKPAVLPILFLLFSTSAFAITPIYGHKVSKNLLPNEGKTFTNSRSDERTAQRTLEKGPLPNPGEGPSAAAPLPAWDPEATPTRKDENLSAKELRRAAEPIKQPWPDGTGLGIAEE